MPSNLTQQLNYNQKHYYKQYTNEALIPTVLPKQQFKTNETVSINNNTNEIESHPLPPRFSPPQIPLNYQPLNNEQINKLYKPNFSLSEQNFQYQKT